MKILIVTSEWPRFKDDLSGIFTVKQVEMLRKFGHTVDVFPFHGAGNPWRYLLVFARLTRKIGKSYDLVHAHHGQAGFVAVSASKGKRVVLTCHGSDVFGIHSATGAMTLRGKLLQWATRWAVQRADRVILVAERMKEHLPNRTYDVIPMGIDTSHFRPLDHQECRRKLDLVNDMPLVLFVGSPKRKMKRFELAQAVVEDVNKRLECKLIFADGVPNDLMPVYMGACDALLITSISEGSPTVLKEAISCGLPIVSVDVGDVRERLRGFDECVVLSTSEVDRLSVALESILRRRARLDGREAARAFDQEILTKRVVDIYTELLSHKN